MAFIRFLLVAFFLISPVYSAELNHMLNGSTNSNILVRDDNSGTGIEAVFSLNLGYQYYMGYGFQLGAEGGTSIADDSSSYLFQPGVTYNLFSDDKEDLRKSYFFKVSAGATVVEEDILATDEFGSFSLQRTSTEFIYSIAVGKRFILFNNVSWAPSIRMNHTPDSTSDEPVLHFELFKMNIFF